MKPVLLLYTLFVAGSGLAQVQQSIGDGASPNFSATQTGDWQTQTTGTPGGVLHAVSAVNGNVCWLAGGSGKIIRTVDGGNTWSLVNSGIIGMQDIHAFDGVSSSTALAGTTMSDSSTFLYRTTDAGSTWELVFSQPSGVIFAIKMLTPTKGIAVGDPVGGKWTILKTTNGGETWFRTPAEPLQVGGASGGTGFGALDTSYVWFFDNTGRQYSSNDGGETWGFSSNPGSGTSLNCWNSRNLGLYITPTMVFRYEFPGYVTLGPPPRLLYPLVGFVGAMGTREFWLVQDAIYYTSNAGTSWTVAPPHGLNKRVTLIDMVTLGAEVSAWATGIGDTVYHYHGTTTSIEEHPQTIPREFSLRQNYPNPFNPETKIEFRIPESGFVSLKVYDVLGREIATLVEGERAPGEDGVIWKPNGVASGIYTYRLSTAGVTIARKMLFLK